MIKTDWLWDRKIAKKELQEIFANPKSKRFIEMGALLLARTNVPQDVFGVYMDHKTFVQSWVRLKNQMRLDQRNHPRITFWQAIYDRLIEMYQERGIRLRAKIKAKPKSVLSQKFGESVKHLRLEKNLSQIAMAKKLGIPQQRLSNIEKGVENMTLATVERLAKKLKVSVSLVLEES